MATETELERMVIRLVGDGSSYQKMVNTAVKSTQQAAHQLEKSSKDAEVFGKTIDNLGTKMGNFAGQMRAMAALGSPWAFMNEGVRLAAQAETMQINFETMLGSADKAKELTQNLQKFAAETPMNMPGITAGAKTLLQFNTTQEDLIPTMRRLGDAAMGQNDKFQRLILAYGQMKAAGRVTNEELNQMREAGFSPLSEMAKILKTDMGNVKEMIARGSVEFSVFEQALVASTSQGGKFADGMLKASKGTEGLWSTMKDDIDSAKRSVGDAVIEFVRLKDAIQEVSGVAQKFTAWFKEISPATKGAIAGVGLLVGSVGVLIVTWKVGAIMTGMIVGVFRDMVISTIWATKGVLAYTSATNYSTVSTKLTRLATVEKTYADQAAAVAAQNAANMEAYKAHQLNLSTGALSTNAAAVRVQAAANAFAAQQSATLAAATTTVTKTNYAAIASAVLMKGTLIALAVAGVAYLVNWLLGGTKAMADFNSQTERSNDLNDKLIKNLAGRNDKVLSDLEAVNDETLKSIQTKEALAKAKQELLGTSNALGAARRRLAEFDEGTISKSDIADVPLFGRGEEAQIKEAQGRVDELQKVYEERQKLVTALTAQKSEAEAAVGSNAKRLHSELIAKYKEEEATLGITNEQKDIYRLRTMRASEAMIKDAEGLQEFNRVLKQTITTRERVNEKIKATVHDLELEGMTYGMVADEIAIYKLKLDGATESQLANARGLTYMLRDLKEQKDATMLLQKQVSESSLSTGAQAFGAFSIILRDLGKEARTAKEQVQRLDAALSGSAEASARIAAFRDLMSVSRRGAAPETVPAVPASHQLFPGGGRGPSFLDKDISELNDPQQIIEKNRYEMRQKKNTEEGSGRKFRPGEDLRGDDAGSSLNQELLRLMLAKLSVIAGNSATTIQIHDADLE